MSFFISGDSHSSLPYLLTYTLHSSVIANVRNISPASFRTPVISDRRGNHAKVSAECP
jgi:hypothetical protein